MSLYKVVRCGVKTLAVVGVLFAAEARAAERPVVVELFTSQSCYSCPPAERFLGALAERGDLVALEFHVDYWNSLVYGTAGRWTDVHSSPAFTERQRAYAKRLPGGVYTPQMVIGGRLQEIGSKTREVERAIAEARRTGGAGPDIAIAREQDGLRIRIEGETDPVPVWLVRYRDRETTRVMAGENRGKTLTSRHIVTAIERIGVHTGARSDHTAAIRGMDGCAVLLQTADLGPVLAARDCQLHP